LRYIIDGSRKARHVSPRIQDERRLQKFLLVSVLLHALILARFNAHREIASHGGSTDVLTVTLVKQKSAASPAPAETKLVVEGADVIALQNHSHKTEKLSTRTAQVNRPRHGIASPTASNQTGNRVMSHSPGKAQALLVIDSSGRVGQIHWYQLPAMTPEEFSKLEQRMRQKIYLSNGVEYTVLVDIE